jgi:hypothetical protein
MRRGPDGDKEEAHRRGVGPYHVPLLAWNLTRAVGHLTAPGWGGKLGAPTLEDGALMMRSATGLAVLLSIAGLSATVGDVGALAGDEAADIELIELPGYGASVVLPDGWVEGDTMSAVFGSLRPGSAFYDRMTTTIEDPEGQRWCSFTAWSELTCTSAVDPLAEIGAVDFTPVALPAGDALRNDSTDARGVCHRYLLNDTGDLFTLLCCGSEPEPDAFLSIARTIELPTMPRTARQDDEQGLLTGVRALASMTARRLPGDVYLTIGSPTEGEHVAHHQGWLQSLEAATGVTQDRIETVRAVLEDESGEMLLSVEGLWVPGAGPDAVLHGYVDWMSNQWGRWSREHPDDAPRFESARVVGKDVVRVHFEDGEAEILYADGSSVVGFQGPRLDLAPVWLEALDCGHIDVEGLLHEALVEEFRSRQ